MVGTSPKVLPASRIRAHATRVSAMVCSTNMGYALRRAVPSSSSRAAIASLPR